MRFFTADTHFGHKHVLDYCNRPFKNVNEMNETMIKNWNDVVSDGDTVYVLGDAFFYEIDAQRKIMKALKGRKILVLGNHDEVKGSREAKMKLNELHTVGWSEVIVKIGIVDIKGKPYGMVHDPALCNIDLYGMRWMCGHVHNIFHKQGNVLNVGVDRNGFKPLNENEVVELFENGVAL